MIYNNGGQGGFPARIFEKEGKWITMIMVIDIGNTNMVLGVYSGNKLLTSWRLGTDINKTADELGIMVMDLLDIVRYPTGILRE